MLVFRIEISSQTVRFSIPKRTMFSLGRFPPKTRREPHHENARNNSQKEIERAELSKQASMAERETEHVRMVDAGRMRAAYAPMFSNADLLASVRTAKFQCVAHGNTYGFSFVSASTGKLDVSLLLRYAT